MKTQRVTKKSRNVDQFAAALAELFDKGTHDVSKAELVDYVVKAALVPGTSTAIVDILHAEMANILDSYWREICEAAKEMIDLPYHYTSTVWYQKGQKQPDNEIDAKEFVIVVGNGRRGKAAGVRFVTPDDEPDPMLLVSLNKRMDVVNAAIKTRNERLTKDLNSPSARLGERVRELPILED